MSGSVGGGPMRLVEPLFFKPLLVPRIWGGERLGVMVDGVPIGESWLFSTLANEETVVEGGSFHGLPLAELANRFGSALLGATGGGWGQHVFGIAARRDERGVGYRCEWATD